MKYCLIMKIASRRIEINQHDLLSFGFPGGRLMSRLLSQRVLSAFGLARISFRDDSDTMKMPSRLNPANPQVSSACDP